MENRKKISITAIVLFVLIATGIAYTIYFARKPRIYAGFGIIIPDGYRMVGIDVSRYQKHIFWNAVSAMSDQNLNISFALIKATEGTDLLDKRFANNWEEAARNRMIRGAYHYFHPRKARLHRRNIFCSKLS